MSMKNNIDDLLKNIEEPIFLKDCGNGIFLNDKHIHILNKYGFDYNKYSSLQALIFDIEEFLNDGYRSDIEDLEWLSSQLAENNYYQNTKK